MDTAEHKAQLRDYFDGAGFQRWSAIYGDGEVSSVRRTIRTGHRRVLDTAAAWLGEWAAAHDVGELRVLDAGCGTGLFSILLAQHGFRVTAVDIAPQMVVAAADRALEADVVQQISFGVGDIEDVAGSFDAVACFDVLIHYPQPAFAHLLGRLAQRARERLIFTYAPHEPLLAAMHWCGQFFPRANRRTEIQMVPEATIQATLAAHGFVLRRATPVRSGFYHVNLVEAAREGGSPCA